MPKISQLSELSSVTGDDLFVVVNDPSGSPATRRVTAQNLIQFVETELGVTPVSSGGTGATTASDARTNLQLPYTFGTGGTSVVAWQAGDNVASGNFSVVNGGRQNASSGYASAVGGGGGNTASGYASAVGGGNSNLVGGGYGFVGGGRQNTGGNLYSAVGGGRQSTSSGIYSFVGGGSRNTSSGYGGAVCGGRYNKSSGTSSAVGGGYRNASGGAQSTVAGGSGNTASNNYSAVCGGRNNTCLASTGFIGSGRLNTASGYASTISGGLRNKAIGMYSTVGGGGSLQGNAATATGSTVSGGYGCTASAVYGSVGGGKTNTASGTYSAVGGGLWNTSHGSRSSIPGGQFNIASGSYSFVGSGRQNTASGLYATIAGGKSNTATHQNVFLLGSNLVSDANDTTYVENLKVKNNLVLSNPISVANGGTGSTNTADLASSLGFGTLALQNQNNVTITGGTISIDGLFNVGLSLSSNSFSTAKVIARSPITDMKSVAEVSIFTVPSGYMFMVDTMEIVTTSISDPGVAPTVRFGVSGSEDLFYASSRTTSNAFGERHIVETPQNGVDAGSVVSFGITEGSTATSHSGAAVVTGYLLKKT